MWLENMAESFCHRQDVSAPCERVSKLGHSRFVLFVLRIFQTLSPRNGAGIKVQIRGDGFVAVEARGGRLVVPKERGTNNLVI